MTSSYRCNIIFMVIITMMLLSISLYVEPVDPSPSTRASVNPQWSTFKGGPRRTGNCGYNMIDNFGEVLWKTQLSPIIGSSPVIGDDGTIYIGTRYLQLYAVDPDGEIKWAYSVDDEIRSPPTLDRWENIFFGSMDGNLYCLGTDGVLNWMKYLNSSIHSSPLRGYNYDLYVGTEDGSLYCLDSLTGDIKWEYKTGGPILSSPSFIYSSGLFIYNDILITSTDGFLYCLNNNGSLIWKYDLEGASSSTPSISSDYSIFATSDDSGLHCVNQLGNRVWRHPTWDTGWASPSIMDDEKIIYGDTDGVVTCLSFTGGISWTYETQDKIVSDPVMSSDDRIVVGTLSGDIYCLTGTGAALWKTELDSETPSTAAIDKNGNVYICDNNGLLYKIGTKPRERPSPPRNLSIGIEDLAMRIGWDEPSFNGNTSIQGYTIARWDEIYPDPVILGTTDKYTRTFVDIKVSEGRKYYYTISAFNEVGDSAQSDEIFGVPTETPKVPGRPVDLKYTIVEKQVTLKWTIPVYEGTRPVTGYHVYRYDAFGSQDKDAVVIGEMEYVDVVPIKGQFYYYTVAAINDVGEGVESDQERVFVKDDDQVIFNPPSTSQADNSDNSVDWGGLVCCLISMFLVIGVPIGLIVLITKAINNSGEKKKSEKIWMDNTPRQPRHQQGRAIKTRPGIEQKKPLKPVTPWKEEQKSESTDISSIIDIIEEPVIDIDEPEDKVIDKITSEDQRPDHKDIIEMDLMSDEIEEEPEMPTFERPKALTDEEKDDFIVERIMELQEMLREGEIDQEMYDTLKMRILDQLDD